MGCVRTLGARFPRRIYSWSCRIRGPFDEGRCGSDWRSAALSRGHRMTTSFPFFLPCFVTEEIGKKEKKGKSREC